jgi:hypothetical protein
LGGEYRSLSSALPWLRLFPWIKVLSTLEWHYSEDTWLYCCL